jgi:hypothetical protein
MDTRIFCLVTDERGRYRVSCRDTDLDRVAPCDYIATFSEAYAAARKLNAYTRARRAGEAVNRHT